MSFRCFALYYLFIEDVKRSNNQRKYVTGDSSLKHKADVNEFQGKIRQTVFTLAKTTVGAEGPGGRTLWNSSREVKVNPHL